MAVVTLDVVLLLPPTQRALAIRSSGDLATSMDADCGAAFRLGADLPDRSDGPAEPHIVDDPEPADPARVRQLQRYGFDDVSDDVDDRFAPHVTLSWPRDETTRTDSSILPPVGDFSARLTEVALYGMGPHGTCTRRYGSWTLTGATR